VKYILKICVFNKCLKDIMYKVDVATCLNIQRIVSLLSNSTDDTEID